MFDCDVKRLGFIPGHTVSQWFGNRLTFNFSTFQCPLNGGHPEWTFSRYNRDLFVFAGSKQKSPVIAPMVNLL